MRIIQKTISAGPDGVFHPGDVVDVPDSEAKQLIAGGYAVSEKEPVAAVPEESPKTAKKRK